MLYAKWLVAFESGFKVGGFFSDISGAFDRVPTPILMAKLAAAGVGEPRLTFFESYLSARRAVVVVDWRQSCEVLLGKMVSQITVLGPCLWNIL